MSTQKTTIEKIEEVLSDKISDKKKRKLELFLINSPLDDKQKDTLIEIIRSII